MHSRYKDKHVLNHKLNSAITLIPLPISKWPPTKATHYVCSPVSHSERWSHSNLVLAERLKPRSEYLHFWQIPTSPFKQIALFSSSLKLLQADYMIRKKKKHQKTQETTKHPTYTGSLFSCTKMHKYTLRKKKSTKILVLCFCSNNDRHWYDHRGLGLSTNVGMHSQGPCEISHLHNSLTFTEVRPRFYRKNKTFRCLGQGKEATQTLRKLGYTELCVLNSCQKDFNMQWLFNASKPPRSSGNPWKD